MDATSRTLEELLKHERFVQRLARSLLRTEDEADDLLQETWLRAVQHPPEAPVLGWLGTVMRNLARDRQTRSARRQKREESVARQEATPPLQQVIEREETRRQIVRALGRIPQVHATAIVLRFFDGLPPREIARRLSVPVETVKKRLGRGLGELRRELDGTFEGGRAGWTAAVPLLGETVAVGTGAAGAASTSTLVGGLFMSTNRVLSVLAILAAAVAVAVIGFMLTRWVDGGRQRMSDATADAESRAVATSRITGADFAAVRPKPVVSESPEHQVASMPSRVTGIRGRVIDGAGAPIPDASVQIERAFARRDRLTMGEGYYSMPKPGVAVRTDATGRFELDRLGPDRYSVLAEKGEVFSGVHAVVIRDSVTEVEITLAPMESLVGEVADQNGVLVAEAVVLVQCIAGPATHTVQRVTGPDGRFSIPLLPPNLQHQHIIRARKPGVGIGSEIALPGRLPPVLRVTLFKSRAVTCRFVPDDGSPPPAGLRFSVRAEIEPRDFVFVASTDEAGTGVIADVPEVGAVHVATDDPRWCLPGEGNTIFGVHRPVPAKGDVALDITVTRTGTLSGTVVDRTSGKGVPGMPIAGIGVNSFLVPSGRNCLVNGVTDDEGRFELRGMQREDSIVLSRTARWLLSPDGWSGESVGTFRGFGLDAFFGKYRVQSGPSAARIEVKVVESATVEGTVADASGSPVEAAEVDSALEDRDWRRLVWTDGRPFREDFTTRTDSAGRFVLRGVYPSNSCRIRARRGDTPWSQSDAFDLTPGATAKDVRIVLAKGRTLVVTVVNGSGAPVEGVGVSAREGDEHPAAGPPARPSFMRRTGKDGSATFESMAAEKVSVGVDPDTLPPGTQVEEGFARVFRMASGDTTRVTIPLREEIVLRGKVLLEDGTAFDEGLISALAVGDAPSGETVEHGRISAGGTFTIRVRSSRFYRIHEVVWVRHIPKGTGADVEMKLEKLVPVGQQDLRPGTPATVVVRRP